MTLMIAPAKINLDLRVTGRRDDGYHTLDSKIIFTRWGDEITIAPSDTLSFHASGRYAHIFQGDLLSVERDSGNLIMRALWIMADKANKAPHFDIHIVKNIPAGAGLGGGSSDAATLMHYLNDYWEMGLSFKDLCAMGLQLGAELPVCLYGRSAHVSGIGDIIDPLDIPFYNILIAWPDGGLETKNVFGEYGAEDNGISTNDLMPAAIRLCPDIQILLDDLGACDGCTSAHMSGSGSACFGVFESETKATNALPLFKNAVITVTT